MSSSHDAVREHYQAGLSDPTTVLDGLERAVAAVPAGEVIERFATFDQFHIGGLASTAELARRLHLGSRHLVLDAGCGLGGPSRYLAATFGCGVIGVDLTPTYIAISEMLSRHAGLAGLIDYQVADIAQLPFPVNVFDVVWTQHAVMNVADRDRLYREFRRVLKPGGQLAFFDPAGVYKDVALLGGYQTMDVDFTANQTGLSLLHCHQQIHMDFGFMTLLRCS